MSINIEEFMFGNASTMLPATNSIAPTPFAGGPIPSVPPPNYFEPLPFERFTPERAQELHARVDYLTVQEATQAGFTRDNLAMAYGLQEISQWEAERNSQLEPMRYLQQTYPLFTPQVVELVRQHMAQTHQPVPQEYRQPQPFVEIPMTLLQQPQMLPMPAQGHIAPAQTALFPAAATPSKAKKSRAQTSKTAIQKRERNMKAELSRATHGANNTLKNNPKRKGMPRGYKHDHYVKPCRCRDGEPCICGAKTPANDATIIPASS